MPDAGTLAQGKNEHGLLILTFDSRTFFAAVFNNFFIFKLNEEFATTDCTMGTLTYLF